ncbi:MAG: TRAP transporter substrate-binding protein DctP [Myxococcota bacterium]|nr:TRAP transporter substrate-binding protein DctP [Myxococcota bacterium]
MRKLASLAVVVGLGALAYPQGGEAQGTHNLNFGTVAPDGTPWADQLRDVQKRIRTDSNGAINVRVFLGGSMGSEVEIVEDIASGQRLQGGGMSTAAIAEGANLPILMMPELPYLFRSVEEADAVLDEVLLEPVSAALEAKGFVLGAWAENGWRNFATTGPATSPEELSAYKMRSQESPVHLGMYEKLGVQAVAKPTSEVLPALNTGIIDGYDNTPLFSLAAGWIEPISHYTLSQHIYQPAAVVYSKRFLDGLPADLQRIVIGDPLMESQRGRVGVRALESELIESIRQMGKTVTELTPEQRKAFRRATKDVRNGFVVTHANLRPVYAEVKAKLQSMR